MTWVELYQVVRILVARISQHAQLGGGGTWSGLYLPGPRGVLPAWSGGVPGLGGVPGWSWGCTYLVLGAYLPGPGGPLVQGYLPGPGGCTWSGGEGYLPGPGEGALGPAGCTWSGGCTWSQGGTCPGTPPCEQNS